jgi:hypothetical protein
MLYPLILICLFSDGIAVDIDRFMHYALYGLLVPVGCAGKKNKSEVLIFYIMREKVSVSLVVVIKSREFPRDFTSFRNSVYKLSSQSFLTVR